MPRLRIVLVPVALLAVVACTLPTNSKWPLDPRDDREPIGPADPGTAWAAAENVNALAAELYAQLRTGSGNLIFSPYSINRALALAAEGAEGRTAAELERVAPTHWGKDDGHRANRALAACVAAPPRDAKHRPELSVANSVWIEQGHLWKQRYLDVVREDYHAGLFDANFRSDPDGARGRINKWVEKETRNHIKDLMPSGSVDSYTRIVLANAIYFKARWESEFEKKNTKPEEFTLASGQKVRAPLMHQKGDFWMTETDALKVLKLPYDGKATSMYVLLPHGHDTLPALEQQLTAENLVKWTEGTGATAETKVWLPRFKFTVPVELGDTLQRMGVREAFDPAKANFKGMTDHPQGLFISRVIHKAFVETDEVGTEAAAATAVSMALATAAPGLPPRVREFRADHPFLFVIKHEPTGAVLFMGRVLDPTK